MVIMAVVVFVDRVVAKDVVMMVVVVMVVVMVMVTITILRLDHMCKDLKQQDENHFILVRNLFRHL